MTTATLKKTSKITSNKISGRPKAKKTATISMRVDPKIKKEAEEICARTGLTVTNAIDIFLYQMVRTQGIPVDIRNLPPSPDSLNLDLKSKDQLKQDLDEAIQDIKNGKVFTFDEVKGDIPEIHND